MPEDIHSYKWAIFKCLNYLAGTDLKIDDDGGANRSIEKAQHW